MKKLLASLFAFSLIFIGCSEDDTKQVEEEVIEESNEFNYGYEIPNDNVFEKITLVEFETKVSNGEDFYVLFGRVT